MKLIRGFEINTNDLSALRESRSFKVKGDKGAVFSLQVKTSIGKFYNFKSKLFETTATSEHRLTNQAIILKLYSGEILFPADADGETYTILLRAEPHFETEISSDLTGTGTSGEALTFNPVLFQTSITQVADIVLTIAVSGTEDGRFTSATFLNSKFQIAKSPTITYPSTTAVSWTIANGTTDAKGFGLVPSKYMTKKGSDASLGITSDIDDAFWHASTTAVINDTISVGGSTHYNYKVDSISDLSIDMTITAISSGTLGSLPTLTRARIGENDVRADLRNKPFIGMNVAKAFANGITLTLKGYGMSTVNKALGCDITLSNFKLTQTPLTTTVRGAISDSTAIDVNGTYGISKGAFIEGFGVDNSVSNPIAGVATASLAEGRITTTTAQTLAGGTTLNIIGSSNSYTITGDITINKVPSAASSIYLDLDKLLTLGAAS